MRRRALLASLGGLSAGCLDASSPDTGDATQTPATSEAPTTRTAIPCDGSVETATTEPSSEQDGDGEFRLASLSASTSVDRPSVRYVLEPRAFLSGDAAAKEEERTGEEQTVQDVSEIADEAVRRAIVTAIRSGEWRSNTLPDGLEATVERVDLFTGVSKDGTNPHVRVALYRLHPDRPPAVEFGASIVDDVVSTGSPGVVEFGLGNRRETTQHVFSGTVPPFGVVFAESVGADERFLLWRDYEEEGCIRFADDGMTICDIGKVTELRACEHVTRRYEVLPSGTSHRPEYTVPPGPGTYRITDSVGFYEEQGAPESQLSFEVELTLESL